VRVIEEDNLSLAWLGATSHLLDRQGRDVNLVVCIAKPLAEDAHVSQTLDSFLSEHGEQGIVTVANTVFPQSLYQPQLGGEAREHLYQSYARAYRVARRHRSNQSGTYFHRLVEWPGKDGPVNQLEHVILSLQRELRRGHHSSIYELGLSVVEMIPEGEPSEGGGSSFDLRIQMPGRDKRLRGFPCLSHISLTLMKGRLHMSALYRNQHFIRKAYGNYVGLGRLLAFLCCEAGCEPGELVCVASHADAEVSAFGRRRIGDLLDRSREASAGSWSDLVTSTGGQRA
jgi:hypothetical protein